MTRTDTPFEHGVDNPVWQPGQPVRLFAMRNESVAMQVVVEADGEPLDAVTVDFAALDGPDGAHIANVGVLASAVGRPIERFVEHFVNVRRASGGKTHGESLGWEPGSGPPADAWVGPVPDALIPVEHAPAWDPYPMHVEPRSNAIVWIDINVPRDQRPGTYRGDVRVQAGKVPLAALPVELEVADAMLPDRTVDAMVFYDHELLEKRVGGGAEQQLWQLLHAHRIARDARRHRRPRTCSASAPRSTARSTCRARGYVGPAPGLGDGVLALGAYGALGRPGRGGDVEAAGAGRRGAATMHLFGAADVFLYAADERCSSPRGSGVAHSSSPRRTTPRCGACASRWTCSQDPSAQPVDVAMLAAAWDPAQVEGGARAGQAGVGVQRGAAAHRHVPARRRRGLAAGQRVAPGHLRHPALVLLGRRALERPARHRAGGPVRGPREPAQRRRRLGQRRRRARVPRQPGRRVPRRSPWATAGSCPPSA